MVRNVYGADFKEKEGPAEVARGSSWDECLEKAGGTVEPLVKEKLIRDWGSKGAIFSCDRIRLWITKKRS
jgi:hypothetical protein